MKPKIDEEELKIICDELTKEFKEEKKVINSFKKVKAEVINKTVDFSDDADSVWERENQDFKNN